MNECTLICHSNQILANLPSCLINSCPFLSHQLVVEWSPIVIVQSPLTKDKKERKWCL